MKKILVLLVILGTVKTAIPEDLRYENCRNCIIINGKRFDTSVEYRKIYDRVRKLSDHTSAVEYADALSTKRLWKELTAIAEVESGFDKTAKGKDGDSGAFQVMPYHGRVYDDVSRQAEQAERILSELLSANANKFNAIRRYNGSLQNHKTLVYAKRVMKIVREI